MEQRETNSNASYSNWRPSSGWGLAGLAAGWLSLQSSSVTDVCQDDQCKTFSVWEGLHYWGYTRKSWSPLLLNSLDSDQTQTNKMKFWTDPTFYSLEGELTHRLDKAKIVWLIVGQLPIKTGWWYAPFALRDFSWTNKQNYFSSNTVATFIAFNDSVSWFVFLHKIVFKAF